MLLSVLISCKGVTCTMTQITYPCCSEVILRPTVIKMTFDILSFGDNEADVINDFNAKLSLIKECCLSKPSYKEGSFKKLRSVFKENWPNLTIGPIHNK